jgi:FAD binding domain
MAASPTLSRNAPSRDERTSATASQVVIPVRQVEEFDVAIVGARCAGSAAAAMLAAAGKRVIVIDRAGFPSDTLSTHAMFPSGLAELKRIGAWERVRDRVRPAQLTHVQVDIDGEVRLRERWQPVLGIDHGASIPRRKLGVADDVAVARRRIVRLRLPQPRRPAALPVHGRGGRGRRGAGQPRGLLVAQARRAPGCAARIEGATGGRLPWQQEPPVDLPDRIEPHAPTEQPAATA